jgi:hypothetical protein
MAGGGLSQRAVPALGPVRARVLAGVLDRVQLESLPLVVLAAFAALLAARLPVLVAPDTWLAFVGGREIVQHGLPHHDTLTVWSGGDQWVDQQWLAQLALYGTAVLGGLRLALALHLVLLVAALAIALVAARRFGASPRSTALGGAAFLVAGGAENVLRAQTLAVPLFALLLWLLFSDARAPSNRVLVAIPLIALWGNLHGTAVLAAALVVLRGLDSLRRRPRLGLALIAGATGALVASPYGLSVIGYYARTIGNPSFSEYVTEWRAPTLPAAWGLFVVAGATVVLVTRNASLLTRYELLVVAALVIAALSANRNAVWLALLSAIVLPRLIDAEWPTQTLAPPSRLSLVALLAAASLLSAVLAASFARGPAWFEQRYPAEAAARVGHVLRADPSARVFSNELFADWLLWKVPEARGRIAFDVRFELLTERQLARLREFRVATHGWRSQIRGYRVVVLDAQSQKPNAEAMLADGSARHLFRDDRLAVLLLSGSS